jgi:hypothetical protein
MSRSSYPTHAEQGAHPLGQKLQPLVDGRKWPIPIPPSPVPSLLLFVQSSHRTRGTGGDGDVGGMGGRHGSPTFHPPAQPHRDAHADSFRPPHPDPLPGHSPRRWDGVRICQYVCPLSTMTAPFFGVGGLETGRHTHTTTPIKNNEPDTYPTHSLSIFLLVAGPARGSATALLVKLAA